MQLDPENRLLWHMPRRRLEFEPLRDRLLVAAGRPHPDFPAHDVRSADRLCAALGAAVGAAGLAGRLRPVDMLLPPTPVIEESERPWAIERVSPQLERQEPVEIGPGRRAVARALPRRRRR